MIEDHQVLAGSGLPQECSPVLGFCRLLLAVYTKFCRHCNSHGGLDVGKGVPFVWDPVCSTAFYTLCDSLIHASNAMTPVTLVWMVSDAG